MKFRFLNTGASSAKWNMACDEVMLSHKIPVLRLYAWNPPAVTIGYFQSLEDEVDLNACKKFGVDAVRRITGGGAVFHDEEITYSFLIPIDSEIVPGGILESYEKISNGIIRGLGKLNIHAQFVPLNDLIANSKKISGNAQTRKNGMILQHGTILLSVDVDKMFSLLKVPDEKMKGKMIETIKERVTSVSDILTSQKSFDEMVPVLLSGFKEEFPEIEFENSELTPDEISEIEKLAAEKYESDEWNAKR